MQPIHDYIPITNLNDNPWTGALIDDPTNPMNKVWTWAFIHRVLTIYINWHINHEAIPRLYYD